MQYIDETLDMLAKARERSDAVIVAYSGGKDSIVVMDLCVRTFKRVEAFMMEFVPGLSLVEASIQFAREKWGIETRRYLHWSAIEAMRTGVYCDTHVTKVIPKSSLRDIYISVRRDTGISLIANGQKRADSMSRRMLMAFSKDDLLTPLAGWTKDHVVGYMKLKGIPLPPSSNAIMSGVDLKVADICWLHDTYPGDFQKLLAVFPYAQAVIERRRLYPEFAKKGGASSTSSKGDDRGEAGASE
jgi:phosphoadenosine phosphosulfate reductase